MLVDSIERGVAIARSAAEAPEIDGVIRILRGAKLAVGEFADVNIVAADTYDLTAEALTLPAAH